MLKVSFLMLLAMALAMAATSAYARVDLFGLLLTSNNQPDHNHAQVQANTKVESFIPYPECILKCGIGGCVCTLVYPPELSMCFPTCVGSTKTSTTKQLGAQSSNADGGAQVQVIEKEKADLKATYMPYQTTKPAEKLHTELVLVTSAVSKSVGEFLPYPECIEKCDECVICTKVFPIEYAMCYCGMKVKKAEGRALPN